jgi:hypothetical protein
MNSNNNNNNNSTNSKNVLEHILQMKKNAVYNTILLRIGIIDGVYCAEVAQSLKNPIPNGPMNDWGIMIPIKPFTNEVLLDHYGQTIEFVWGNQWFDWVETRQWDAAGGLIC